MAKTDQATTLRQLVQPKGKDARPPVRKRKVRVLSVTSGKGGVGKTNIAINLAYALAALGRRVFILDADLGLANIDVLLNLTPAYNIEHVLSGEKNINEIIVDGPNNIKILPASSGISELAELDRDEQMNLFRKLGEIDQTMDYMIVDTGAGIASNVLRFNATADEIILVVTPEPTSMTDAYSLIKILSTKYNVKKFFLLANNVESKAEANAVYDRLNKVVKDFLKTELVYMGFVFRDPALIKVVRLQKPLLEVYPRSPAARCFFVLAKQLDKLLMSEPATPPEEKTGNFWERLRNWKKNR